MRKTRVKISPVPPAPARSNDAAAIYVRVRPVPTFRTLSSFHSTRNFLATSVQQEGRKKALKRFSLYSLLHLISRSTPSPFASRLYSPEPRVPRRDVAESLQRPFLLPTSTHPLFIPDLCTRRSRSQSLSLAIAPRCEKQKKIKTLWPHIKKPP